MAENDLSSRRRSSGSSVIPVNAGLIYNRSVAAQAQESTEDVPADTLDTLENASPPPAVEQLSDCEVESETSERGRVDHIIDQSEDSDDKKERKKKHKELKPISKKHPEYELAYDMMLGIRTVVGRIEAGGHSELEDSFSDMNISGTMKEAELMQRYQNDFVGRVNPEKFSETKSYRFPKKGGKYTPSHYMKSFKFKDYCPQIFKMLRQLFSIDPGDYQTEVCGNYKYLEFISNSKSGQFFFYSHNQRFMVKTMSKTEAKLLRKIMPQYYSYIRKHPHSLLTKFFGMHRVKPHRREHIYFIIMGSVFYSQEGLEIHEQYDLKGSTKGRKAGPNEKMKKDLDLMLNGIYINVGRDKAKLYKQQLLLDTEFLRKNQIMDYSLLVGIHYRDRDPMHTLEEQKEPLPEERKEPILDRQGSDGSGPGYRVNRALSTPLQTCTILSQNEKKHRQSLAVDDIVRFKSRLRRRSQMHPRHKNHYKLSEPLADLFIVPEIVPNTELGVMPEDDVCLNPIFTSPYSKSAEEYKLAEEREMLENPFTDTCGGMCFKNPDTGDLGNEIYFTGVIDLLQQFNRRKKVESFLKTRMNNPQVISAVDPELYSRRFNRFIEEKIM